MTSTEWRLLAGLLLLELSATFLTQVNSTPTLDLKSSSKSGIKLPLSERSKPWCETKSFRQKIRHRGCETKFITNKMCYGQCWSFFIPKRRTSFESCSFCTPVEMKVTTVVLNCPGKTPDRVIKKIKVIGACKCRVCGRKYI